MVSVVLLSFSSNSNIFSRGVELDLFIDLYIGFMAYSFMGVLFLVIIKDILEGLL